MTSTRAMMAATVAFGAAVLVGVPSAGLALEGLGQAPGAREWKGLSSFTPATVDPDMARLVAERGTEVRMSRFTPAGMSTRANRSMTVAVRVNEREARAISVRSAIEAAKDQMAGQSGLPITSTRYNLGLSRGYQNFAKPPQIARGISDPKIPDLAEFRPSAGVQQTPSRFAARIDMEDADLAGAAPRTLNANGDQTVGVAGSYRLTRNIDVTAGVRYSQDRDRIAPISDPGQKDSQAVYIGTQFRF